MQNKKEITHYIFVFSCFSAVFFVLGLVLSFLIPKNSLFSNSVLKYIFDFTEQNFAEDFNYSISLFVSSFLFEIKYLFFALLCSFSTQKQKLLPIVVSYKGFTSGFGCAYYLSGLKGTGVFNIGDFICGLTFIFSCVGFIFVLCWLCSQATIYSTKIIYPFKLKTLFKRKDFYAFLLDFSALIGTDFILTIIKTWSFIL